MLYEFLYWPPQTSNSDFLPLPLSTSAFNVMLSILVLAPPGQKVSSYLVPEFNKSQTACDTVKTQTQSSLAAVILESSFVAGPAV